MDLKSQVGLRSGGAPAGKPLWILRHWKKLLGGVLFAIALLGVTSAGSFFAGAVVERRTGFTGRKGYPPDHDLGLAARLANYTRSFRSGPERIEIELEDRDRQKLVDWHLQAVTRGQITSDLKGYLPAHLEHRGHTFDILIRLTGGWAGGPDREKLPLHIRVEGGGPFSIERWSLRHPEAGQNFHQWLYLKALEREGIARLRYDLVRLIMNGDDLGVYTMAEVPAEQIIEGPQRGKGVALGLLGGRGLDADGESDDFDHRAGELLKRFLAGKEKAGEAFDIAKLALYLAISELSGFAPNRSRLLFVHNVKSSRLEPVGKVEVDRSRRISALMGAEIANADPDVIAAPLALLLSDPELHRLHVEALERVSSDEYIDKLLADLRPEIEAQAKVLHREWPSWHFNRKRLDRNAEVIRAALAPTKGIHAYLADSSNGELSLDVAVIQMMPVEILSVTTGGSQFGLEVPAVLAGKPRDGHPRYNRLTFDVPESVSWSDELRDGLQIQYRLRGTERMREARVFPWRYIDEGLLTQDLLRLEPNLHLFPFLEVSEDDRVVKVKPGEWQIRENLILPRGYRLVAEAGVRLDLVQKARVISHASLHLQGSEESPVLIHSTDGTGEGIAVLQAGRRSVLEQTHFDSLSAPAHGGWYLTGAVTFFESPVEIRGCKFTNNRSEDSLNIIRSDFLIEESAFSGAPSDSVDIDFSDGTITDSAFFDVRGDAVDFSGSSIELQDIEIRNVSDKGLSIGEGTHLRGRKIEISETHIGVAAKDSSYAELTDISLSDAQIGLAAYQKKPEYGPPTLSVERLEMERTKNPYVVESRSTVVVDARTIPENHTRVLELIEGGMFDLP
jgi:hypothetical protein